ncbi:MAG: hypothetical protein SVU88_00485 [Candidatus Nanohaloarchaea archaeon]|nr:hypothetical protein [Candidatus Nanohaloarchaea archaeon]
MEMAELRERFDAVDRRIASLLAEEGVVVLRYSLALIFIWFGGLKLIGGSPAVALVAETVYWFDPAWFVPVLGAWELLIGLCFLYRPLIRAAIALLAPQMLGTFLPFLLLPATTFEQFPLLLTLEGQYIMKNLVVIGAAMVVGGTVRR